MSANFSVEKEQWGRLIAHAWKNPQILDNLRKNPDEEIERLKKLTPDDPDYVGNISSLGTTDSAYYFPLPEVPTEQKDLSVEELQDYIVNTPNLFGIMRWCCI